jgi:hypothetical protein
MSTAWNGRGEDRIVDTHKKSANMGAEYAALESNVSGCQH